MKLGLFVVAVLLPCVLGIPVGPDDALIVAESSTTEVNTNKEGLKTDKKPKITEMHIKSNITNRFAHTLVRSKVKNGNSVAQETTFFVVIPEQAFISSFVMQIGDKNYTAYVQEKEKAKKTYEEAVSSGYGAAHVAVNARDSNKFTVTVNIEPQSKAIFYLTYEELLERKNGYYEQVINIHPRQLVQDLNVEVKIDEQRPLVFVKAPSIRSGNEISKESENLDPSASIDKPDKNSAVVNFKPDYEKQKQIAQNLGTKENEGMAGQFVVQYEVERDPHGGEVLVKDGYFVHFFAPSDLKPLNKHVVFVLDTSGSMYDRKMEQLKHAMKSILGELNPKDYFNLVEFNTDVKVWNLDAPSESTVFPDIQNAWYNSNTFYEIKDTSFPPAYPVNNDTITKANNAVKEMYATGGTNIYEALRVGIHLIKLKQQRTSDKSAQPLIFFLTDGDATVGKTSVDSIISSISEENSLKIPIISLSFGTGADREFLEKISLANNGFARHIYEESDASLQLENFYKEVSSPLLHNVRFKYEPNIESLTRTEFPILYEGTEFIVAGKYQEGEFKGEPLVQAWDFAGPITLKPSIKVSVGGLERLWAYMTVRRYLDAKKVSGNNNTVYDQKALDLAVKYSFVTPVTSLVVVKPNATNTVETEPADNPVNRPLYAQVPASMVPHGYIMGSANRATSFGSTSADLIGGISDFDADSIVDNNEDEVVRKNDDEDNSQLLSVRNIIASPRSRPRFRFDSFAIGLDAKQEVITTQREETTTILPVTLPPDFKSKLPWLDDKLRIDGSLSFFKGSYMLGFNETSPANLHCTTPQSKAGDCKLVKECEKLYPKLQDVQSFKDNFCIISLQEQKYAGVCCPKD